MTLVACLAMVSAAPEAGAMIGCEECVNEMRKMGDIIRHHAPGLEVGISCLVFELSGTWLGQGLGVFELRRALDFVLRSNHRNVRSFENNATQHIMAQLCRGPRGLHFG